MLGNFKIGAILPAAGKGKRMGSSQSKQFLELQGKPIILHTLKHFQSSPDVDVVVLVADNKNIEQLDSLVTEFQLTKVKQLVQGGKERQDSVWQGLLALKEYSVDIVIVHDAVRPFIDHNTIHVVLKAASADGAAIVGVHPKDTIKSSKDNHYIAKTMVRDNLWVIQTPQAFQLPLLVRAYEKARSDKFLGTDDASLVERLGIKVRIIQGTYDNIKITTPEDLQLASLIADRKLSQNT